MPVFDGLILIWGCPSVRPFHLKFLHFVGTDTCSYLLLLMIFTFAIQELWDFIFIEKYICLQDVH